MEWAMESVKEKAKDYGLMGLQNLAVFMMGKVDKECPAMGYVKEKANVVVMELENLGVYHWLKIGSTYAIPITSMLWFFYGGGGKVKMLKGLFWFIFGGGGNVKMMKAPGRGGYKIPRSVFEFNPKAYFRNLRSG